MSHFHLMDVMCYLFMICDVTDPTAVFTCIHKYIPTIPIIRLFNVIVGLALFEKTSVN